MKDNLKIQPHNDEAEKAFLGCLLASYLYPESGNLIDPKDISDKVFYSTRHRLIYEAIQDLRSFSKPVNIITVEDYLKEKGLLEEAGGASYISSLLNLGAIPIQARHYLDILIREHRKRKLYNLGLELTDKAQNGADPIELANMARRAIEEISRKTSKQLKGREIPKTTELLFKISDLLKKHVYFRDKRYPLLIAIWILGTYIYSIFKYYGYLWVNSPARRCGKSLLLDILAHLCCNATSRLSNVTEAALFRIANTGQTLILDEIENLRSEDKDKYGATMSILNAGFQSDGKVPRVEKDKKGKFEIIYYNVFCPKILAGIARLVDTIVDRCFQIPMARKTKSEKVERFNLRKQASEIEELCEQIHLWGESKKEDIEAIYNGIEELEDLISLDDRFKDIAEPLIAIASYADAEADSGQTKVLPELVSLFLDMAGRRNESEKQESIGAFVQLADELLALRDETFITSEDLLNKIKDIEDLSWIGSGKALATYLSKFDLIPRRNFQGKKRGYLITRVWMEEVKNRYLSSYVDYEVSNVSES